MQTISQLKLEIVPAYDYSWRCDCDEEGISIRTLAEAKKEARQHLKRCVLRKDKSVSTIEVFIDKYDLSEGELCDVWWKVVHRKSK